jgi:hypothetical protein
MLQTLFAPSSAVLACLQLLLFCLLVSVPLRCPCPCYNTVCTVSLSLGCCLLRLHLIIPSEPSSRHSTCAHISLRIGEFHQA